MPVSPASVSDDIAILISDVRHGTNNALMAILGYLEILLAREGEISDDTRAKLKHIEGEAYRIRDLIARTAFIKRPRA
ncbi:MAG TPA: histidine kinase dimerization/phospho-acceptor domain-containing protein [Candidatus Polarisedimenticolaceae bacterium]|nr:histidine kinase dimerization/phospho-acceptor domain-containing protein [Candidatus Polarisedimenticolaceae bacterium]